VPFAPDVVSPEAVPPALSDVSTAVAQSAVPPPTTMPQAVTGASATRLTWLPDAVPFAPDVVSDPDPELEESTVASQVLAPPRMVMPHAVTGALICWLIWFPERVPLSPVVVSAFTAGAPRSRTPPAMSATTPLARLFKARI